MRVEFLIVYAAARIAASVVLESAAEAESNIEVSIKANQEYFWLQYAALWGAKAIAISCNEYSRI